VDLSVVRGRVGVGVTNQAGDGYLQEKFASDHQARITIDVLPASCPGGLVFRNADVSGEASEFIIHRIHTAPWQHVQPTYLVKLSARDFIGEERPRDGDIRVFDDEAAQAINRARIEWIEAADLPVGGKRVLDAGCGVGHFASFYLSKGCTVVGVDGRQENIDALRARFPQVDARVGDVQHMSLRILGPFDVVHCFGLLYHLDSPVAALRNLHAVCRELLILETMVCDSSRPLAVLADETKTVNQALEGLGTRPSPSFVSLALNRVGFRYVYGTTQPPRHPDFLFSWQDNLDTSREGHTLRCVFVASHAPLDRPLLVSLLDQ
jgi:SAM-dependent methyltransferase